jgi:cytochrome c556
MSKIFLAVTAICALAMAGLAWAQAAAEGAAAVRARQANFKLVLETTKQFKRELDRWTPNVPAMKEPVAHLGQLAPQVPVWFPAGSGAEAGVKTKAKPEIWAKPADFSEKAAALVATTGRLDAAVQAGDLAGIRAAWTAVDNACSACHAAYEAR